MAQFTILVCLAIAAVTVSSEPLLFSAPLIAAPGLNSAFLASPAFARATALSPAPIAPAALASAALGPAAVAPAPLSPGVLTPYSSVSSYVYGAGYSSQDYILNPSAQMTYGAYSLPYAYAADWYFRR